MAGELYINKSVFKMNQSFPLRSACSFFSSRLSLKALSILKLFQTPPSYPPSIQSFTKSYLVYF